LKENLMRVCVAIRVLLLSLLSISICRPRVTERVSPADNAINQ